ncbi:M28 family peptidase [Verrucomicrobia bacterium]|nr:M28 family peptidase [Verrucomicrobiota bacterium]NCG26145.1 M28 family peptidase [Verrucomicrobiales bacterium]
MQINYKRIYTLISFAVLIGIAVVFLEGCKPNKSQFSGVNAYQHVQELVNFGPRIPGTQAIENARLYLEEKLQEFGWVTVRQSFNDDTPKGSIKFINLRARFPTVSAKDIEWKNGGDVILVCSHYDTKLVKGVEFIGANDGGSSTGVLVELARLFASKPELARKVELVFFDGEEAFVDFTPTDGLYGSRHYAKFWRSAPINKKPRAAFVLDLVGDKEMRIDPPYDSPSNLLSELYRAAQNLGYRSLFGIYPTPITDDHVPLNAAGIPALDIIDSRYISKGKWHTSQDNLNSISENKLEIIGRVVVELIKIKI